MNNTVYDIDFTRVLPDPLKNDENILALGRAIAGELQENIRLSRLAIIYARLDELDENILDILARDLHVDWYEDTYPVEAKRQIIKDSVKVHKRLGTKYAVESVIRAYFGSGEVREWYEYGGEPHHFKIISGNPSITNEQIRQFFDMLESVKRKSSWLDAILITLTGEMSLYMGVVVKETNREAHIMGADDTARIYLGVILDEHTAEAHAIGSGRYDVQYGTLLFERTSETYTIKEKSN